MVQFTLPKNSKIGEVPEVDFVRPQRDQHRIVGGEETDDDAAILGTPRK